MYACMYVWYVADSDGDNIRVLMSTSAVKKRKFGACADVRLFYCAVIYAISPGRPNLTECY